MQIAACLTLGHLAYERQDRATAIERYEEALEVAVTHPPFAAPRAGTEKWVNQNIQQIKENYNTLVGDGAHSARTLAHRDGEMRAVPERREVVDLPGPNFGADGSLTVENSIMFTTYVCGKCSKREGKLLLCIRCMKLYCMFVKSWTDKGLTCFPDSDMECQSADWICCTIDVFQMFSSLANDLV